MSKSVNRAPSIDLRLSIQLLYTHARPVIFTDSLLIFRDRWLCYLFTKHMTVLTFSIDP